METLLQSELWAIPALFLAGSIFHFIYRWSKYNKYIAVVGAVNESIWEHMKLAFWPMLFWSMVQYIVFADILPDQFLLAKTASLAIVTLSIPLFVYAYTRILRKFIFPIDLSLFLVCIALSQYASFWILSNDIWPHWLEHSSIILMFILVIIYSTFTLRPPRLDIFRDPTNKKFGEDATNKDIKKKSEFVTPVD